MATPDPAFVSSLAAAFSSNLYIPTAGETTVFTFASATSIDLSTQALSSVVQASSSPSQDASSSLAQFPSTSNSPSDAASSPSISPFKWGHGPPITYTATSIASVTPSGTPSVTVPSGVSIIYVTVTPSSLLTSSLLLTPSRGAAPTPTPSPLSTQSQHRKTSNSLSGGAIAGVVIGVLAALALLLLAGFWLRRRSRRNKSWIPKAVASRIPSMREKRAELAARDESQIRSELVGSTPQRVELPADEETLEVGSGKG